MPIAGHRIPSASSSGITLEFYLDYVCPFSAKQFRTLYSELVPYLKTHGKQDSVNVIFRHQVQPWHPTSTLVHEAGIAVSRVDPANFWDFSAKLFEQQNQYFDEQTRNESRTDIYKRLAKLAASCRVSESQFLGLVMIEDGASNGGNKVTDELKSEIKLARQNSVHVSPTVLRDGLVEGSISSSYTLDDWKKYLEL